jgi:hypothetical protein
MELRDRQSLKLAASECEQSLLRVVRQRENPDIPAEDHTTLCLVADDLELALSRINAVVAGKSGSRRVS